MGNVRKIIECPKQQGIDEKITRTLTVSDWGASPTTAWASVVRLIDGSWIDYSSTCLTTTAVTIATTNTLTLPAMMCPEIGATYRLIVTMLIGGNTESAWGEFIGEK